MSTAQLVRPGAGGFPGTRSRSLRTLSRTPPALAAALILLILFAAFSNGATTSPAEARLQVALSALAAIAAGAWLWTGSIRLAAPRLALAGTALLATFALWSGVSVTWSVAPDNTWLEFNRVLAYVTVLWLAIALGASSVRAVKVATHGFVLVGLAVTIYGLGQKLVPGLHVGGLFDLNQTGALPRLEAPLGYWNALALMIALAAPLALALAADRSRSIPMRLAAAVTLQLMLLAIGFSYSRGGVLALALGLAVGFGVGGTRLRSLMWLAVSVVAALPPLVFGLVDHSLTATNVGLGAREDAGAVLSAILIVCALLLLVGARRVIVLEDEIYVSPARSNAIGRLLVSVAAALIVIAVIAVGLSSRGLVGTVSHAWDSFTTTRSTSVYDPHRLLSADSENRWVWWKEALGAFSDRPIAGWGAGSFPVVHLLYRRDELSVKQPHSVPLQWFAETGVIGGLLAAGAFALLLWCAVRAVRRVAPSRNRLLMAAMMSGAFVYAVHAFYDWDWDIPAVTLPALLFLGLLAGMAAPEPITRAAIAPRSAWLRLSALAAVTVGFCTYAVSAALPSIAASEASASILTAGGASAQAVQTAQHEAAVAARLDPLSDAGPRAEEAIAQRRKQLPLAASYLLDAVHRDPTDASAWTDLAYTAWLLGDVRVAEGAAARAVALDPRGAMGGKLSAEISTAQNFRLAPPLDSATAQPLAAP